MPLRLARVVAAFGIAGVTSVCAAYGKAMNEDFPLPDSGTDSEPNDTNQWLIDTSTSAEPRVFDTRPDNVPEVTDTSDATDAD